MGCWVIIRTSLRFENTKIHEWMNNSSSNGKWSFISGKILPSFFALTFESNDYLFMIFKNESNYKKYVFLFVDMNNLKMFFTIERFQLRGQLSQPNLCLVITKSQIRGGIM